MRKNYVAALHAMQQRVTGMNDKVFIFRSPENPCQFTENRKEYVRTFMTCANPLFCSSPFSLVTLLFSLLQLPIIQNTCWTLNFAWL